MSFVKNRDVIRPATPADADALAALHRVCFDDPWRASDLHALLSAPGGFAVIAPREGFCIMRLAADEAEVHSLGVVPERRGAGLGGKLLDAALVGAALRGAVQAHLEVAIDNSAALRLYKRAGFVRAGLRRAYYARGDGRVDAIVLTAVLPPPQS